MLDDQYMEYVKEILTAAYPRQQVPPAFYMVFKKKFGKYDEDDVADALDNIIDNSEWFPSIAGIRESLMSVLEKKRRERQAEQAAQPLAPAPPTVKPFVEKIREMTAKKKQGQQWEWTPPITDELRDFADRCFNGITDEIIKANYPLLAYYAKHGRKIDDNGSFVRLAMSPNGTIDELVVVKKVAK